jgi:hypothetical protein
MHMTNQHPQRVPVFEQYCAAFMKHFIDASLRAPDTKCLQTGLYTACRKVQSRIFGAFAKLQQATDSFVMPVRPSGCPSAFNNSALTEQIFMKFYI